VGGGSAAHAPPLPPAGGGQQRDPGHGSGDPGQGKGGAEQDLLGQGAPTTVAAVSGAAEALVGYQPFGAKSSTTATTTDSWATFE